VPQDLDHIIWYYAFDKGPAEIVRNVKTPYLPSSEVERQKEKRTEQQKCTHSNKIRRQPSMKRGYKVGVPLWQMPQFRRWMR